MSRAYIVDGNIIGSVVIWKGNFGWIWPDVKINHPEANKHGGRIYVSKQDVDRRLELYDGARVSFTVYADGDGLGAEAVRILPQTTAPSPEAVPLPQPQSGRWRGAGNGAAATTAIGPTNGRTNRFIARSSNSVRQNETAATVPSAQALGSTRWWEGLAGDCCPISLTPLEELTSDPFGLVGTTDSTMEPPSQGIWGSAAVEFTSRRHQSVQQSVHWFDGMFLASFLVSSGQHINPVNRRPLSRGECVSLDDYLAAHAFPAMHVADAFDLAQAVSGQQVGSSNMNLERIAALEREAASMLRSLFDFRSTTSSKPPSLPSSHAANALPSGSGQATDQGGASASTQRLSGCTRRTVHNEGGLTVVDDGEFDEHWEEKLPTSTAAASSEPTPAEALALNRAPVGRQKSTRMPRAPRGGNTRSGGDKPAESAQVTFAVTGWLNRTEPPTDGGGNNGSNSSASAGSKPINAAQSASASSEIGSCDVWVPDWATSELHERLLAEIEGIEFRFDEDCTVLTPGVRAHLQDCVGRSVVTQFPDFFRIDIRQHIDGPNGGRDIVVNFALPPYYPMHAATVVLRDFDDNTANSADDNGDSNGHEVLVRLQQALRSEVLTRHEGAEVVLRVLEWLTDYGPAELARFAREANSVAASSGSAVAPAAKRTSAGESKRDRVEQARRERMCSKYSQSWDLCYAFIKHGHCKDKDCAWRHDQPEKSTGTSTNSTTVTKLK